MQQLLILLLCVFVAAKPPQPQPPKCDNCVEEKTSSDQDLPLGSCCFGDKCLGTDYSEARCPYVWAGVGTNCEDCEALNPCCHEFDNGRCELERCFDCVTKGGKVVHDCKRCENKGTTTDPWTPMPTTTKKPPKTLPSHPPPTSTKPPTTGCCCIPGKTPRVTDPHECHDCDGIYRGDGTTCHETDICLAQCCKLGPDAPRSCLQFPNYFNPDQY